ncbi:hypothetical protein SAMN04488513_10249 [Pseudozobellia thermophila]|uniref:Uncharacterized protein n=2 Tax=Pseudozobellia thermophila TaxID=192903 RepID=A0A1M6EG29_9FLAO|nr:hypothetical protein SAMN04488513_10249 [Pseudozobellia thermophila]
MVLAMYLVFTPSCSDGNILTSTTTDGENNETVLGDDGKVYGEDYSDNSCLSPGANFQAAINELKGHMAERATAVDKYLN